MKNNPNLIAILCGLLAAWLFLGQVTLGGPGALLSTFTAMPLFVSVLGFGTRAGLISSAVAGVAVGGFFGITGAMAFILLTLVPTVWVGHMVGLSQNEGTNDDVEQWFPVSTILFRMAGMSAAIAIILGVISGYSHEWASQHINTVMSQFIEIQSTAAGKTPLLTAEQIVERSKSMATLIPAAFPASLFFLLAMNLALGERFARKREWMLRPKQDLPSTISLPILAVGILVFAIAASFIGGTIGIVAQVLAGAFGAAFIIVGLASIHSMTRGFPVRGLSLGITYLMLLFSRFMGPVLAVLGVVETIFQLRSRFASGSNKPK